MDLQEVQKQWLLSRWIPLLKRHSVKANWALRSYRAIGLIKTLGGVLRCTRGRVHKVLFVHTGGLLGMYDKADQLAPLVAAGSRAERLEV